MKSRTSAGYTIVEVLIVLAVTSALFISAAAAMSGKQSRTEFTQGLRGLESKIQSTANEVSSGFYQNGYKCTAAGGSAPALSPAVAPPGSNKDCIFLGKVMHFGLTAGKDYRIYTVVGRRQTVTGDSVTTLQEAQPVAVAITTGPDVTEYNSTNWGVYVTKVFINTSPITDIGSFAFFNQLSGDIGSAYQLSGSRSLQVLGVSGTTALQPGPTDQAGTISKVQNSSPPLNLIDASAGIIVCVKGGNDQLGQINVGTGSSRLSTAVLIDKGVSSDCIF